MKDGEKQLITFFAIVVIGIVIWLIIIIKLGRKYTQSPDARLKLERLAKSAIVTILLAITSFSAVGPKSSSHGDLAFVRLITAILLVLIHVSIVSVIIIHSWTCFASVFAPIGLLALGVAVVGTSVLIGGLIATSIYPTTTVPNT